jgi:hypothetical protein
LLHQTIEAFLFMLYHESSLTPRIAYITIPGNVPAAEARMNRIRENFDSIADWKIITSIVSRITYCRILTPIAVLVFHLLVFRLGAAFLANFKRKYWPNPYRRPTCTASIASPTLEVRYCLETSKKVER